MNRKLRTGKRDNVAGIWKLRTGKRSEMNDLSNTNNDNDIDDSNLDEVISAYDMFDDEVPSNDVHNDVDDVVVFVPGSAMPKRGSADSWKLRTGKRAQQVTSLLG
jgi:hypothetical protein